MITCIFAFSMVGTGAVFWDECPSRMQFRDVWIFLLLLVRVESNGVRIDASGSQNIGISKSSEPENSAQILVMCHEHAHKHGRFRDAIEVLEPQLLKWPNWLAGHFYIASYYRFALEPHPIFFESIHVKARNASTPSSFGMNEPLFIFLI